MRLLVKENKILLTVILVSVIISMIAIGGRIAVEKQNKTYDIVLDYAEMEIMAEQSDHDLSWWLSEFQTMGIQKVGLAEETLDSLLKNKNMPVEAELMNNIMKDANWKDKYPADFIDKMYQKGFDEYDVLVEMASTDAFDFVTGAMTLRYPEEKYLIWQTEQGGFLLIDGSAKETLYSQDYKYMTSVGKGFVTKDDMKSSKLMFLNLGLLPSKVAVLQDAGMEIIPRTASYDGWNDKKYLNAVLKEYDSLNVKPQYLIVGGECVPGYDDGIEAMQSYLEENQIKIGLIENTTQRQNIAQKGVNSIVQNMDYNAVRIFSVWDYIQNRYQYYGYEGAKEIENTLFRAVVERNIRLIYFKPIKEYKDDHVYVTNVEEYRSLFSNLENRLEKHNIKIGQEASIMPPYFVALWEKIAIAFGGIAAAVLLIGAVIPMGRRIKLSLLGVGSFGVLAAFFVMPSYSELLTSFLAAVVFPCLAILLIVRQGKEFGERLEQNEGLGTIAKYGVITLIGGVVISLLGGIMTAAPISSVNYLLEIDIFRGVKAAQLIPILFFVLAYLAYFGFGKQKTRQGILEYGDVKELLNASVRVWMLLAGVILLGVGYYYISRTGNDAVIEVSSLEMLFRNGLEDHLIARPRNKEFLFAFPAVIMFVYTCVRRFKLWTVMFGLCSVIGMTCVNNTFMHIRTPLYLGLARTGYSLVFGIILGVIGIFVFEMIYKIYRKLERQNG